MNKRIISLLITFLASISVAYCQIDTVNKTVSVVAYWGVGDKYEFDHTDKKMKVNGQDTVYTNHEYERFSLEVVAENEIGYLLKYEEVEAIDYLATEGEILFNQKLDELFGNMPLYLQMDSMGSFIDIANWEEVREDILQKEDLLRQLLQAMFIELEAKKESGLDIDQIIEGILAPLTKKESVLISLNYVIRLFLYNGYQLSSEGAADWEEERPNMFTDDMVETSCRRLVYDLNTETEHVQFITKCKLDPDQLLDIGIRYYTSLLGEDVNIQDTPTPNFSSEDFTWQMIHVGSGWTTGVYYEMNVTTGDQEVIRTQETDMVFDEE